MNKSNDYWQISGHSVMGSLHVKKELPNQDAYGYEDLGQLQVLVLSDGHGGQFHPYSDIGSKIAIEVVLSQILIHSAIFKTESPQQCRHHIETTLSKKIQERWREKVAQDSAFESHIQYGCTLLIAVIVNDVVYFIQLGDGKCAIVYQDGTVYYPVPKETRYSSNETLSLSQANAWAEMKVAVVEDLSAIHLIALASDGVENAYPGDYYDDALFFLNMAYSETLEQTIVDMTEAAMMYSRDDTTVVAMKRRSVEMLPRMENEGIQIWKTEYPDFQMPLAQSTGCEFNKRLEHAIQLCKAIENCGGIVSKGISLQSILRESQTGELFGLQEGELKTLSSEEKLQLVNDLIDPVPFEFQDFEETQLLQTLVSIREKLRFCYETHTFSLDQDMHAVSISGYSGAYELFYNSDLYMSQVFPLTSLKDHIVGTVIQHKKYPDVWGIQNRTNHIWYVYHMNGSIETIFPEKIVTIKNGVTVFIYGVPIRIDLA